MHRLFCKLFALLMVSVSFNNFAAVTDVTGYEFRVESGFAITANSAGDQAIWFDPKPGGTEVPNKLAEGLIGSDFSEEPTFHGAPSTLSWGNGSSLSVGGETKGHHSGFMPLDGTMVDTVEIEFVNGKNGGTGPALSYGLLADGAWLKMGGGELHTPLFWHIYYLDTPDNGNCPSEGCSDIAVVQPEGMTFSENENMFTATFEPFPGFAVTSLLQIQNVSILDDAVCGLFGNKVGKGCTGIILPEGEKTTLQVSVGSRPPLATPLPPAFLMFGSAGCFLLAFVRKKKPGTH